MDNSDQETKPRNRQRLTRSRDDRYIGGVAAGLATHFSIDPILIRIAFIVTLAFGGTGAIAYLILLFMVPVEGDPSAPLPPIPERRRNSVIAGAIVFGIVIIATRGRSSWLFGIGPWPMVGLLFWAALIVGVIWLVRRGTKGNPPGAFSDVSPSQTAPSPTASAMVSEAPTEISPENEALAEQQRRDGGAVIGKIMTAIAIGLAVLVTGLILAIFSSWITVIAGAIPMAAVLVAIGIAMVVLAINGRRTIALWLLPAAIFIGVPMAVLSLADIRVHGTWGQVDAKPVTAAAFPSDGYQLAAGQMTIDMRGFDFTRGQTVDLPVKSGFGYTQVIVPDDVCVTADVSGKAGLAQIRGTDSSGVDVNRTISAGPNGAPGLHVDADFQLGFVQVLDASAYLRGKLQNNGQTTGQWSDHALHKARVRADAACQTPAHPPRSATGVGGKTTQA